MVKNTSSAEDTIPASRNSRPEPPRDQPPADQQGASLRPPPVQEQQHQQQGQHQQHTGSGRQHHMERGKPRKIVRQIGDRQGIAQGQTGQQGQQADHNTLPQPGLDQRQFGEHHGKISPRHHPPVDEAPVVVLSGDGDHREVGAEPLHTPGKQQGVGGDQKAGEQIQPEAPPPENAGGPHCFSAPVSSPCSSSCTVRISLPVFFRMSSSRMPSVMLDTRE